jgi:hypothetical protein
MRFLADRRLYTDTGYCLQFLRGLDAVSGEPADRAPERFHLYWRGELRRKQIFCLKSLLVTQQPDTEVWLWLDREDGYPGYEGNPLLRPLLPFVRVLPFEPGTESRGTPVEGHDELHKSTPVKHSNFVRHLVLFKYGGIYADLDVMFLRDFRLLRQVPDFHGEFAYQWSSRPFCNSAILRLDRNSETARTLLELAISREDSSPRIVLRYDDNEALDVLALPCSFFDPLWLTVDGEDRYRAAPFRDFKGFFRHFGLLHWPRHGIRSYRDFFPGAFSYHWHNLWHVPEYARSYYGRFEKEFDDTLARRLAG